MHAKMITTVRMDDIPNKVSIILKEQMEQLENTIKLLSMASEEENHVTLLENIDEARKNLSFIDASCDDCYTVLVGYLKYKADKATALAGSDKKEEKIESNR